MDDLLREFLTETNDSLDTIDVELVRFEQEPNNAKILDNIFRLVHTIKGTCGFLGLPRLEVLAHAAETLMGKFRDGMPVTGEAVSLVLATIDRIKDILAELERSEREPDGTDVDLIQALEHMAAHGAAQVECDADKSGPRPGAAVPRGHSRDALYTTPANRPILRRPVQRPPKLTNAQRRSRRAVTPSSPLNRYGSTSIRSKTS
jgi:two-component system chemotaxis sensor kinase CheA